VKNHTSLQFSPGAAGPLLAAEERAEADWRDAAVCATTDPELFFPDKGESSAPAKRICMACPVRAKCLEDALENREFFGILGGTSERERRRILRNRAQAGMAS
jgi:WhiB family redox-sensing transcriptional regulator